MKLHEIKKNERIYIAKKVPGKKLDQLKFVSYRTTETKSYLMEQCKEITKADIRRTAIWAPRNGMGVYSEVINLNINGDKTWMGYSSLRSSAAYIVVEEDNYVALVEPIQMNFFCNIAKEDY